MAFGGGLVAPFAAMQQGMNYEQDRLKAQEKQRIANARNEQMMAHADERMEHDRQTWEDEERKRQAQYNAKVAATALQGFSDPRFDFSTNPKRAAEMLTAAYGQFQGRNNKATFTAEPGESGGFIFKIDEDGPEGKKPPKITDFAEERKKLEYLCNPELWMKLQDERVMQRYRDQNVEQQYVMPNGKVVSMTPAQAAGVQGATPLSIYKAEAGVQKHEAAIAAANQPKVGQYVVQGRQGPPVVRTMTEDAARGLNAVPLVDFKETRSINKTEAVESPHSKASLGATRDTWLESFMANRGYAKTKRYNDNTGVNETVFLDAEGNPPPAGTVQRAENVLRQADAYMNNMPGIGRQRALELAEQDDALYTAAVQEFTARNPSYQGKHIPNEKLKPYVEAIRARRSGEVQVDRSGWTPQSVTQDGRSQAPLRPGASTPSAVPYGGLQAQGY